MKNQFFTLAVLVFPLVACQPEGRIYSEHKTLSSDLEWKEKDQRKFNVPIENTDKNYDMSLAFRYANGYQFDLAKIQVTEIDPDGIASVYQYNLKVRDENGEYIGEPGLDIWDSEHVVEKGRKFAKKGTYTYVVKHVMPQEQLNFAMEIGVVVDEAK